MTDRAGIDLLRYALASVWTECEKDAPEVDDIRRIVGEALALTEQFVRPGKDLTNGGTGLEGWLAHTGRPNA